VLASFQPAGSEAFDLLLSRLARLKAAGLLPYHEVLEAALQFHALCEGLVVIELRELARLDTSDTGEWRHCWSQAIHSLVVGFAYADVKTPAGK
jgi:hypothetical protein